MGWKGVIALAATACCLSLPAQANGGFDDVSFSNEVEIIAFAFDGGGDSAVQDPATQSDFDLFDETVEKSDSNRDSGRRGRSKVIHKSQVVRDGNTTLGFDSEAKLTASSRDPQPSDSFVPFGRGTSELTVEFEIAEPTTYTFNGGLSTSTDLPTARRDGRQRGQTGCTRIVVTSPNGSIYRADSPSICGSETSVDIDEAGELQPGTHSLTVTAQATSGQIEDTPSALALYDVSLRFCTITVQAETTNGTEGDDVICGTEEDDTILGHGGSDRIFGFGGADTLEGGAADDDIDGGDGDDKRIYGGPGDDTIAGGVGDDGEESFASVISNVVAGGPGNDEINGGPGLDVLVGRCGGEEATVCPADPVLLGELDDDNLIGGDDNDVLRGDAGVNFIEAGDGNDVAFAGDSGDTLIMGDGQDGAQGGNGNDRIEGGAGNDGDDLFAGNLFGGGGNDCLIGGRGRDDLDGVGGNDTFIAKDNKKDKVDGGPGPDRGKFDPQDNVSSVANKAFGGSC